MIEERALLLAEALESGRYEQGDGWLERHDGEVSRFCCLGVACRVAQANGVELIEGMSGVDGEGVSFDGHDTELPDKVQDWFGFQTHSGAFLGMEIDGHGSLIGLNDSGDYDFPAIARVIRNNWEVL
jgi:hypothetical protein